MSCCLISRKQLIGHTHDGFSSDLSLGSWNWGRSVTEVAFFIDVSHVHAAQHPQNLSTARSWLDFRQLFPLYCSSLSLSFLISSMAHFSFDHYWLLPPLLSSPPLSEHRVESKGLKIKHITPTYTQQKRLWHLETHGLILGWKTNKYVKDQQRLFLKAEAWVIWLFMYHCSDTNLPQYLVVLFFIAAFLSICSSTPCFCPSLRSAPCSACLSCIYRCLFYDFLQYDFQCGLSSC